MPHRRHGTACLLQGLAAIALSGLALLASLAPSSAGMAAWIDPAWAGWHGHALAGVLIGLSIAFTLGALLCGLGFARASRHDGAAAPAPTGPEEDHRSEARLRDLLVGLDQVAIIGRDLQGVTRFWSRGCERLYGWSEAEAIGRSAHELLRTAFPVPRSEIDATLLAAGEWTGHLHQRSRQGEEISVFARATLRSDGVIIETMTDVTGLRRTETELRRGQARLQAVLDTAAESIVVVQADGRILSVNHAALLMFGYNSPQELIGRDLGVLMPQAVAAWQDVCAARRTGAPGHELVALRRNGPEFPVDLSVSAFEANSQRFLCGIIRDATARRQAEAALCDTVARLRLVQQVGGIAYTDWTLREPAALISDGYPNLYGLRPGKTHMPLAEWCALIHPDDRDWLLAAMGEVRQRGTPLAAQFRICRPGGAVRWIDLRAEAFLDQDGQPVRMITAQRDITEIVTAHEAEAAAEARFRAIFDSQFQFITLLAPDGTVLEVNHTMLEAGGFARDAVVGHDLGEAGWWPQAERERLRGDIAEAARGTLVRHDAEILGTDGRSIWIDFSLKPVRDPATQAVQWIIAEGRDITEQRNLSDQLAQAQKVQALGQLAGGIAHDFNNILQAVSGAATLIARRPEDLEKTRRLARTAIDAAARGASITQRLLAFAHRGELRTEMLPTAELLTCVREVLAHTLGSAITVRDTAAAVPPLIADRGQLETALVNLGTNARDAMPEGGTLTLAAAAEQVPEGGDHPAGLAPGAYVRLSVTDTGTGMEAATLARATDPFFTTKPPGQGTGLGLAMVKGFVEQSGGAMAIDSAPGAGTTVTLWLRQASEDIPCAATEDNEPIPSHDASARLLLVDDDDLVRETLAAQLEDLGFDTLLAASGAEAISLLEAGEAVDAMVSDLSMPDMNGVTTIQRARALRPRLPCFLLTGYMGERAALPDGDSFTLVRKPVSARALAGRIEAGLEARQ
ncbi:Histidine kinase [Rhodovastum atsumiense]|uniref:histidine kinase n=1 Tax=Rhodovastum atsumiense TaxID=504468 RepID=A0A5M6IZY3_9PROT|nr:PAS domain S-box protein [Rhodovastum atsumiense]KAA5613914.1 PAS domain S-box protein [Rhodovastum atsumiense]CAH2602045.1 Histidine kinase [Rhodovastum atsumiense]